MNVLVTGAAGFIGSHLVERLLKDQHQVVGMDNFDPFYAKEIKLQNLKPLPAFSFYECSLFDREKLQAILAHHQIDSVIHLAARAGIRPSLHQREEYLKINRDGTEELLKICAVSSISKFVFGSSSSVYGDSKTSSFKETDPLSPPLSPYAESKVEAEKLVQKYSKHFKSCHILRFFTVYGPRQRPDLAISNFFQHNLKKEAITLYGDGSMQRDFTYVTDIVEGISLSLKHSSAYDVYNLGNHNPVSLKVLLSHIEKITEIPNTLRFGPQLKSDIPSTCASIKKAHTELGYQPKIDILEGLKLYYEWLRKNPSYYDPTIPA